MGHETEINGTGHGISGGQTEINGTGYRVKSGRTKIKGADYDIPFGGMVTVTFKQIDPESLMAAGWITIEGVEYAIRDNGTSVTLELKSGSSISIRRHGDAYGDDGAIKINGKEVEYNSPTSKYDHIYTIPAGVRNVTISSSGGGFMAGVIDIVES